MENPKTYSDEIFDLYENQNIIDFADLVAYETYIYLTGIKKFIIKPDNNCTKDSEPHLNVQINVLQQTFNYF